MLIERDKLSALVRKVTGQEQTCELCFGECRTHNLGRSEEWEPEIGSQAWANEIEVAHQELVDKLAESEQRLADAQSRRKALLDAMREIREIAAVGDAKPDRAGILLMGDKLDKVGAVAKAAIVEEGRPGLR